MAGLAAVPTADAAPGAPAAPTPLTASGPFSANANVSMLTVEIPSLTPEIIPQTNVDVANSLATADSVGTPRTAATAATTGTSSLLGGELAIQENHAEAPPSSPPSEQTLLPIDLAPLLNLPVINTAAVANWISDTECIAATDPLSQATQFVADATVLEPEETQSLLALGADGDGAVDVEARTGLPAIPGQFDPRAVEASVTPEIATVDVLNNLAPDLASAVTVEVLNDPGYVVRATGLPGGATVEGADPVVRVTIGGDTILDVTASSEPQEAVLTDLVLGDLLTGDLLTDLANDLGLPIDDITDPLGAAVADVLAAASPVIRVSIPVTKTTTDDGTFASVDAAILRIELLAPTATGELEPLADALATVLEGLGAGPGEALAVVNLAPMHADATAPLGGITCGSRENPLDLAKFHSGPAIPGSTFDYTIHVGNVSGNVGPPCTMDPVRVVDTLTGPAGSTIVLTEPAGATVTPIAGGFKIEWANVGPLAPGGATTLRIRVQVPAGATVGDRYHDTATATTTCNGQDLTREVVLDEPAVVAKPTGPCNITGSRKGKTHIEVYPGESFSYFVNVLNSGSEPCTSVTVTDTLDSRLTFESCSDGCTNSGQNVTWNLGTLAGGQSVTLRVQVKVNADATGELANTAVIDTAETGPTSVSVAGPRITGVSVLSDGNPAVLAGAPLSRTGGMGPVPVSITVALAAAALGLHRLRRRAIS